MTRSLSGDERAADEPGDRSGPARGTLRFRVRYSHTDRGGVVYHANYLDFFEWGRTEFLRERGATYRALEDSGHLLVVVEASVRYLRPATYDDLLQLETTLVRHTPVRLEFEYRLHRPEDDTEICEGRTVLGALASSTRRPARLPGEILELFSRC